MKADIEYKKRELLIEEAKKEFLERGYNKASLRTICSRAGVTTGALYFFFKNKEELFAEIVDRPLKGLKELLKKHFKEDREYMSKIGSLSEMDMDHSDESDMFIDYIYRYRDSFILVLGSSENTVYENSVDEFVDMLEKSIPYMLSGMDGYTFDEYMSHWMAHLTIDAFTNVIRHIEDADEAKRRMRPILNYLVKGWVELAMVKEKDRADRI
ncbi:MAG: TetR/AcrR family transcriptional regulator [Lachnospiraceae bacterium]|nr:TetR/AcrR family transcriptional regulator [Lachnospiraceae bacterium]